MQVLAMFQALSAWFASRAKVRDEDGATLVEYGLLVALIAVAVMATVGVLGGQINTMFCSVATKIGAASGDC